MDLSTQANAENRLESRDFCMKFHDISVSNTVYLIHYFISFVGCKGWEVDFENHRNGNNL